MEAIDALVVGGGPAGLMAADVMSAQGLRVVIAEAKPSPARKLLMAGKSGLNITKDEPLARFKAAYPALPAPLAHAIDHFGPTEVQAWMTSLGQAHFTGSTGRVFPKAMKGSPLLRAWLAKLEAQQVELRRNWRLSAIGTQYQFETPEGVRALAPKVCVLALGGASWARLGSDGAWADLMPSEVRPFEPSNFGIQVEWSDHMTPHFGRPLKNIALRAGDMSTRGECVISERGLEGGGIYMLSPALREGAPLIIDLLPDMTDAALAAQHPKPKETKTKFMKRALRLTAEKIALSYELEGGLKSLSLTSYAPRPLDEAISTAGGVRFEALTDELAFKAHPDRFAAGEMLDWDAPTGGYLLTACLASGRLAGLNAARRALQGG